MLIPLLALAILQTQPDQTRASYLYAACKGAIRFADEEARSTGSDIDQSLYCTTYISGFIAGAAPIQAICDDNPTMLTFARVYVAYMDKHPTKMELTKGQTLREALLDAYPCRKK